MVTPSGHQMFVVKSWALSRPDSHSCKEKKSVFFLLSSIYLCLWCHSQPMRQFGQLFIFWAVILAQPAGCDRAALPSTSGCKMPNQMSRVFTPITYSFHFFSLHMHSFPFFSTTTYIYSPLLSHCCRPPSTVNRPSLFSSTCRKKSCDKGGEDKFKKLFAFLLRVRRKNWSPLTCLYASYVARASRRLP